MDPLYQVFVETRKGERKAVGFRMNREACEHFVMAVNKKIAEGKEQEWSNPHIARVLVSN